MQIFKNAKHIVFVLFLLSSTAFARVNQNGDFQIWNYLSFEQQIKRNLASRLLGEWRFGDQASRLYLTYIQLQGVYKKNKLEIAPGYRQEYSRPEKNWRAFYTPLIDITFFFNATEKLFSSKRQSLSPIRDFFCFFVDWEDRNRIFYQIPEHLPASWIYRNRLRMTSSEITRCLKLKLFLDEEIFLREREGFFQNRVSFGLFATFNAKVSGRIYYIYRLLKQDSDWTYQDVLAFQLFFTFGCKN